MSKRIMSDEARECYLERRAADKEHTVYIAARRNGKLQERVSFGGAK